MEGGVYSPVSWPETEHHQHETTRRNGFDAVYKSLRMTQRGAVQRGRRGARGQAGLLGGRYALRSLVGEGGMAEVFSAIDGVLDRPVAVKVLREHLAHDSEAVARFRREARAVAAVSHPNIVSIHDVGTIEQDQFVDGRPVARGRPFLITELIVGQPLDLIIRRDGPMPAQRVAEIGEAVAAALAFAHGSGIVHRDLKPANVMLTPWGHVKVLDFGIALAAAWTPVADGGRVHGTAEYLSPEQARGWAVDGRSDIYSLGVVLYELLTGRVPFAGENSVAVAYQHLERIPERPSRLRPDTPPELERVILRCLEKDPRQRYDSAGSLRAALRFARLGPDARRPFDRAPTAPAGAVPLPPPPPVAVEPAAWPTVPHVAPRGAPTAVDPMAGRESTAPPGRHRRRWRRGIGGERAGRPGRRRRHDGAGALPRVAGREERPAAAASGRADGARRPRVLRRLRRDGHDRPLERGQHAGRRRLRRVPDRHDRCLADRRGHHLRRGARRSTWTGRSSPGDRPSYYVRAIAGKRASVPTYSIRPATRGFCLYGTG